MPAPRKRKVKKDTSFATWKFELENTVNADPQTDGECLQILRAYLDFMGSPDARPYRSLIDLKVATSLAENTIINRRRRLISLGYFKPDGKTSDGATRFQIVNARGNIVLDHQLISRETLRRLEAEKKERVRGKRRNVRPSPSRGEGPLSPSHDEGLKPICPLTARRDSPSRREGNYVENTVESYSNEKEGHLKGAPPMDLIPPSDPAEARMWLFRLCADKARLPWALGLLGENKLTPEIIRELAS
jgi:hypothetical protein